MVLICYRECDGGGTTAALARRVRLRLIRDVYEQVKVKLPRVRCVSRTQRIAVQPETGLPRPSFGWPSDWDEALVHGVCVVALHLIDGKARLLWPAWRSRFRTGG
jgi:hypothetical protein